MDHISSRLPYRQTGSFSRMVLDYVDQAETLRPFFSYPPTLQGAKQAIENRRKSRVNREALVAALEKQYTGIETSGEVRDHIRDLLSPDTFTVTTAHQNNLFTGPLYFIYKIVHAIRLARHLKASLPEFNFVPVFYMGSEDADLAELDHIYLGGEKLTWETSQKGAVGRMKIDGNIDKVIARMEGELNVHPFGNEIMTILKQCYQTGLTMQEATFRFVDRLFSRFGLVILIADSEELKKQMIPIFEDDLLNQRASGIVSKTINELEALNYKVQANPREINLFYLKDGLRERIESGKDKKGSLQWMVLNTDIRFTRGELLEELIKYPQHFSPNVIFRGIYQETILPNIAFIGGGGELAYWLQLKELFAYYKVPFPVLVLRNSYLVVEKKQRDRIAKLGFEVEDLFHHEDELLKKLVLKLRGHELKLNGAITEVEQLYDSFKKQAAAVDATLEVHVDALRSQAIERLLELEKKMVRAEKRKFVDQQRQIQSLRNKLFPGNGLQERRENICYYYSKWGGAFIDTLLQNAGAFEQEFCLISFSGEEIA